jgi:hypothetical protein
MRQCICAETFVLQNAMAWACGDLGLLAQLDPETLLWAEQPSPTSANLSAIVAVSEYAVWAAGRGGAVVFFDGRMWTRAPAAETVAGGVDLFGLAATTMGRMWCVGANMTILFFNGAIWVREVPPAGLAAGTTLYAVSAAAGDDVLGIAEAVFAVGAGGAALRRDDVAGVWVLTSTPVRGADLLGVFTTGPNRAWTVGYNGSAARWNGTAWVVEPMPAGTPTLHAIDGDKVGAVAAVGVSGAAVALHWSGKFLAVPSGTGRNLFALSARTGCAFFGTEAAGLGRGGGRALLFSPDNWHAAALRLYCGSAPRRDFSQYDALEFYMRNYGAGPGTTPTFQVSTWDRGAPRIALADYMDSPLAAAGSADDGWRRVLIPLARLRTDKWALGGVETLAWLNGSAGCDFAFVGSARNCDHWLVDDITVLDLTPPHVTALDIQSATIVMLVSAFPPTVSPSSAY